LTRNILTSKSNTFN